MGNLHFTPWHDSKGQREERKNKERIRMSGVSTTATMTITKMITLLPHYFHSRYIRLRKVITAATIISHSVYSRISLSFPRKHILDSVCLLPQPLPGSSSNDGKLFSYPDFTPVHFPYLKHELTKITTNRVWGRQSMENLSNEKLILMREI